MNNSPLFCGEFFNSYRLFPKIKRLIDESIRHMAKRRYSNERKKEI